MGVQVENNVSYSGSDLGANGRAATAAVAETSGIPAGVNEAGSVIIKVPFIVSPCPPVCMSACPRLIEDSTYFKTLNFGKDIRIKHTDKVVE
ncbi:hypothetical protein EVAR_83730_1 [Eumeta japonica]|uniref:Uncharacterized protein n=1 Tax=Eumeta variegata TaxID=151549 RepID=A0A4C1W9G3_EUMVA|nr:hypothetical protein EVAR_83730_1 [Eumeta japonica]